MSKIILLLLLAIAFSCRAGAAKNITKVNIPKFHNWICDESNCLTIGGIIDKNVAETLECNCITETFTDKLTKVFEAMSNLLENAAELIKELNEFIANLIENLSVEANSCSDNSDCKTCFSCDPESMTCQQTGDFGCPCTSDMKCPDAAEYIECKTDQDKPTCACQNGYYYDSTLKACVKSVIGLPCYADSNCTTPGCTYCDDSTKTCQPKAAYGCPCLNVASTCASITPSTECSTTLSTCQCVYGFTYDSTSNTCIPICSCSGHSAKAMAGIVIGGGVLSVILGR